MSAKKWTQRQLCEGGDWNFNSNSDGTWTNDTLKMAAGMETVRLLKHIDQNIERICHFFHNMGDLLLIAKEQTYRHQSMRRRRLAAQRKRRSK